uniref:Iron-sulfur cluster carrier protein n=1 Tax=Fervidicoccus fontis TaxID=683846 RepID=A0A7C1E3P3_9CREN
MESLAEDARRKRMAIETTRDIKYKFVVLSGKGGVGKSLVSANLALAFSLIGYSGRVGLLDADIHGATVPLYLGLTDAKVSVKNNKILPVTGPGGIRVFSISFLLEKEDLPVIWRGPLKTKFIEQSLADVDWSGVDVLIVDTPPGTGDEPMAVVHSINKITGAVLVTTPAELSVYELEKTLLFLKEVGVRPLGVIENMSYVDCGGEKIRIFGPPIDEFARQAGLEVLGHIPIDPLIGEPRSDGEPYILRYPESPLSQLFVKIAKRLLELAG